MGKAPLSALRLDPENPRIPETHRTKDTAELATLLEMGFEAYTVAQSIVELGFFNAEPLIVIPSPDEAGAWIVVEGNRRLTALIGLAYPEIRAGFATPDRWEVLATKRSISADMVVPIVIHESRATTHAEIARVHVVGKLGWRPFMQARYIAARVAEGRTLQEVADLIGIPRSKAADLYRDQAVLTQAAKLGLETSQVESAFSLLTVAMGSTKIRNHVGAPLGSQTVLGKDPVPADKAEELREVIQWVFGDEEHESRISDSRQISQLGNVIASEVGLAALREGKTLEEAKQRIQEKGLDPLKALTLKLNAAKNSLYAASSDVAEFAMDLDVQNLVDDIESLVGSIRSTLDDVEAESGQSIDD
ncbi:hypothetical protein GA707_06555 [Nostocoides sp. F2B08]|uniref:hypothetical protein n=1 Tax=Nostocoides sp. F2B08 TaxID=2653936 RepID=UPI001262DEB4|nr:hypothetical protein [Tetrasphaera sp. F2B08]KAB7745565.1 hypothetical protein GA707_06555 [Tetrasphaera sp. F2B08]